MEVELRGMVMGSMERCPVNGGKVKSFDATATRAVKGVKQVVQVSNGVAVVADTFWAAVKGRRALKVTWDEGSLAQVSTPMIDREDAQAAQAPGPRRRHGG